MGLCDLYDSNDYDWSSYANEPNKDDERFTSSFPYEYDKEAGMSRAIFDRQDVWKDCLGREYEQKIDCWGTPYYEPIEKDDDSD